jgi:hypothetical protein
VKRDVKLGERFCRVPTRSGAKKKCIKARSGDAMMAAFQD